MTKEELLEEFDKNQRLFLARRYHSTAFNKWFASALDRYALSIVEQSVPEEARGEGTSGEQPFVFGYVSGVNEARMKTLEKAQSLTNQEPKET